MRTGIKNGLRLAVLMTALAGVGAGMLMIRRRRDGGPGEPARPAAR
jgi:hypothetical protein